MFFLQNAKVHIFCGYHYFLSLNLKEGTRAKESSSQSCKNKIPRALKAHREYKISSSARRIFNPNS